MSQIRKFTNFSQLPYDIRYRIWLLQIPADSWKIDNHIENLRDILFGSHDRALVQKMHGQPCPWASLGACPESRRLGFEIVKRKLDELV